MFNPAAEFYLACELWVPRPFDDCPRVLDGHKTPYGFWRVVSLLGRFSPNDLTVDWGYEGKIPCSGSVRALACEAGFAVSTFRKYCDLAVKLGMFRVERRVGSGAGR